MKFSMISIKEIYHLLDIWYIIPKSYFPSSSSSFKLQRNTSPLPHTDECNRKWVMAPMVINESTSNSSVSWTLLKAIIVFRPLPSAASSFPVRSKHLVLIITNENWLNSIRNAKIVIVLLGMFMHACVQYTHTHTHAHTRTHREDFNMWMRVDCSINPLHFVCPLQMWSLCSIKMGAWSVYLLTSFGYNHLCVRIRQITHPLLSSNVLIRGVSYLIHSKGLKIRSVASTLN